MLYARGIVVHCTVWLASCVLHPFIWPGVSPQIVTGLMAAPFVFGLGLPFHLLGSGVWMAPFLLARFRRYEGAAYHLWVAFGSGIAVFGVSAMATSGDSTASMSHRYTPAVLAFVLALLFSLRSERPLRHLQGLTKRWSDRLAASLRRNP